jgi:beta-glucanase (GH16 family)
VLGHDIGTLYTTVHWAGDEGKKQSGCRVPLEDATRDFRLYGVLWTDQMIVHYLDRVPVSVIETKPELDAPMYMIANLAVGGTWPGAPDDTTVFPASFEIDWIAAYRLMGIE